MAVEAVVLERSVVADGAVVTVAVLPPDIGPLRLLPAASGLGLHPAGTGSLVRRIGRGRTGTETEGPRTEPAGDGRPCDESLQFHDWFLSNRGGVFARGVPEAMV